MHRAMKSGHGDRSHRVRSRQGLAWDLTAWPTQRAYRSLDVEGGGLPARAPRHDVEVVNPSPALGTARAQQFFERLKDRKLVQWLIAYLGLVWLALQLTDALREVWEWPPGLQRGITLGLGLSLLPAAVVAWYHGERGRQAICPCEVVLLIGLLSGSAALIWRVCG